MVPGEYYVRIEVDGKAITDEKHCGHAEAKGLFFFLYRSQLRNSKENNKRPII